MKLYALLCLLYTTQNSYSSYSDSNRSAFRTQVLQIIAASNETDIIIVPKLATLLADISIRDFPNRWSQKDFMDSVRTLFTLNTTTATVVLSALRSLTEDCTDSDFNTKVSTTRRNDVLQGLNEISEMLLPLFHQFIQHHYSTLLSSKQPNNPNPNLTSTSTKMLNCSLQCLKVFSIWMPLTWADNPSRDFVAIYLHLLREKSGDIHVMSATCLDCLCRRKLGHELFLRLLETMPQFIGEADRVNQTNTLEALTEQLPFHLKISEALTHTVALNIAKITDDKTIFPKPQPNSPSAATLMKFLTAMSDMMQHPCVLITGSQINTWVLLCRDPQVQKSGLLSTIIPSLFPRFLKCSRRVNWDLVDSGDEPLSILYEEAWGDREDYEIWLNEVRGKLGMLVRLFSVMEPVTMSRMLLASVEEVLGKYGGRSAEGGVSKLSEAYLEIESLNLFVDQCVQGCCNRHAQGEIDAETKQNLGILAGKLVGWIPDFSPLYMQRHACFMESLRHFFFHDPLHLPTAVLNLFNCVAFRDAKTPSGPIVSTEQLLPDNVLLRRKAGTALVSLGKACSTILLQFVDELLTKANALFNDTILLPPQIMHLIEFLTCVANATQDNAKKTSFIDSVLTDSVNALTSGAEMTAMTSSVENLLSAIAITPDPTNASVTDPVTVERISANYSRCFSALNQIMNVGKRCDENTKSKESPFLIPFKQQQQQFTLQNPPPTEGPISLTELAQFDAFVHLWPQILPALINTLSVAYQMWAPEIRCKLLSHKLQRYALALSDEEAIVATKKFTAGTNPMEQVEQTGYVCAGTNKRKINLVPRWAGWMNELRNCPLQMLGLLASQRALFCPELQPILPSIINIFSSQNLKALEHRHLIQLLKQFIEPLLHSTPYTLYGSYLTPILTPILSHLQWRLDATWKVNADGRVGSTAPSTSTSDAAAVDCSSGNGTDQVRKYVDSVRFKNILNSNSPPPQTPSPNSHLPQWFETYYSYCGLFCGDMPAMDNEAAVEKLRTELTHAWCDTLQSALALKGEWALTLANIAKENDSRKKNNNVMNSKVSPGIGYTKTNMKTNADGTIRTPDHVHSEALQLLRIDAMSQYLTQEESVAGPVVMTVINCLKYPDAHTNRRAIKICHRILESTVHLLKYENILGTMFQTCAQQIVSEPKWMVGVEWDIIALLRDLYCRLVLGQALTPGGQGPGLQCNQTPGGFVQHKNAANAREGGGISCKPSDIPRNCLASLPGQSVSSVQKLEISLNAKRAAKDQKAFVKDFFRVSADIMKRHEGNQNSELSGMFGRAGQDESVLKQQDKGIGSDDKPVSKTPGSSAKKKKKKKGKGGQGNVDGVATLFGN
ncbi:hypothetical protein TL16_g08529 [Triparma laevis f. inornata]|uniref:Uncharacterized protein n=1 Tax=Triparma laevis f. inornata TaxID=1714386 RepID=A0A9W7B4L4_9STRA|nr:hypothetical protein TL16_g08529 [Triparma laevis f. inornata]